MLTLAVLTWLMQLAASDAVVVVRCEIPDDARGRTYELRKSEDGDAVEWTLAMRSKEAGTAPVLLPMPDAAPVITADAVTLAYQTLNGGRDIELRVTPSTAMLDVHANFELEVNIEPDLDPRVELMNTGGPITGLACAINPAP